MTTQHRENHRKMVKAMKYVAEGKTSWEPMDFGTISFYFPLVKKMGLWKQTKLCMLRKKARARGGNSPNKSAF